MNTGNGEQPYSANSLVAQWDFNDTSGTTLTASSSGSCTTACNGTLTNFASTGSQDAAAGTGWTANNKRWGAGGLMISGVATADLISITDPASNVLDPNSADLTLETWIKTNDISAEIFSNNNANGTACTGNGYYLGVDASGYPAFYLDTNGATAGCDASTTSQFKINDGNWHQVAVSITRGTSAVIYVDGKAAGSDTSITSYSAITVTGNAFFGGSAGGLDAILDSTHIYSRALSAAEILSNYQAGNIEIQTRTGATSDPNDGTWEAWKPTTGETQLLSMDSDAANWRSDIMASTTIATSTDTVLKMEGTGSLKIEMGKASSTAGTVALWHFEETGTTTGTYLYDETANNNDATTTGTTIVGGIFGKARSFNGTSDYVSVNNSALDSTLSGANIFTIGAWIKTNTLSNSHTVFGKGVTGSQGFALYTSDEISAGQPYLEFEFTDNGNENSNANRAYYKTDANTIPDTNWHYVVVVIDVNQSSINKVKFYIDGVKKTTSFRVGTDTLTTIFNTTADLVVGNSMFGFWNGNLDELFISSRALSADEIAETYRMGANHHLTRQISAADLSAQTKLPFWIAADRTGTFLEAMIGESDHANYELASSTLALSTTTVLYIKGDEIASSTSLKDSSFSGKAITAVGDAKIAGGGKIGNALSFVDGTGDWLSIPDSDDWDFGTGNFSIDLWVYHTTAASAEEAYVAKVEPDPACTTAGIWFRRIANGTIHLNWGTGAGCWVADIGTTQTVSSNAWHHVALVRSGATTNIYIDGVPSTMSGNITGSIGGGTEVVTIGNYRPGNISLYERFSR